MARNISSAVSQLSDHDILARVHGAVQAERHATANLIALLVELDTRRLYLGEGFSSLFTYCTQALHLSEHAAYNRIETARTVRRFPVILDLVESGAVTLTAVRLLAPHLTDANHRELLERAHTRANARWRSLSRRSRRLRTRRQSCASCRQQQCRHSAYRQRRNSIRILTRGYRSSVRHIHRRLLRGRR